MAKVFKVTPKRIKRSNGLVLTPDTRKPVASKQISLSMSSVKSKG